MNSAKYLIIGNSAAGVGAVTGIRQMDAEGSITLLAKETEHAYSRPLITYLLGGKVSEDGMLYRPMDFYDENRVNPVLGAEATAIDPKAKKVVCADGSEYGYEKLLIAVGGTPIVPPGIEGIEAEGVFTFTTWADSKNIAAHIDKHGVTNAVVVGGGLIGLKSVEALVARGVTTTVVELAPRILAITLDDTASSLAAGALAKRGVTLITNNTVSKVKTEGGRVSGVVLRDGQEIEAGLLIMAIGVIPDLALAKSAGVECERGILVDPGQKTSDEAIFAAGDVCQALEILSGQKRSIPIWPLAVRQGMVAGANMAGGNLVYEGGLAMNSVEICGLPTISAGITTSDDPALEVISRFDEETGHYRKVVLKDGRVVGSVFVGDIDRAGIITGLMKSKLDVTAYKERLVSDDFGLISLPSDYRVHVTSGLGVML